MPQIAWCKTQNSLLFVEWQNIPSWKEPIRIMESNSWLHTGSPKNQTLCLRALSKCFFNYGSLGPWSWRAYSMPTTLSWKTFSWYPTWPSPDTASYHSLGPSWRTETEQMQTGLSCGQFTRYTTILFIPTIRSRQTVTCLELLNTTLNIVWSTRRISCFGLFCILHSKQMVELFLMSFQITAEISRQCLSPKEGVPANWSVVFGFLALYLARTLKLSAQQISASKMRVCIYFLSYILYCIILLHINHFMYHII